MGKRYVRLTNFSRGQVLAARVEVADGFFSRLRGLMGRGGLGPDEGLWLKPCNGVHMFFMRFAIDVVFLDGELQVVEVIGDLPPWKVSPVIKGAKSVVELPAGSTRGKIAPGDQLAVDRQ